MTATGILWLTVNLDITSNEGEYVKASEGSVGRVFILRLDDGDTIPDCIERFATDKRINTAQVILLGGIGGGKVVVGPENSANMPPKPIMLPVDEAHEVMAVGLIAADEGGKPVLHVHGALGRAGHTLIGCLRPGVATWLVGEAIVVELLGTTAIRRLDEKSGFTLLEI